MWSCCSNAASVVCADMRLMSLQLHVVLQSWGVSSTRWPAAARLELHDPLSCTHMTHWGTSVTCWPGCIRPLLRSMNISLHCSSAARRLVSLKTVSLFCSVYFSSTDNDLVCIMYREEWVTDSNCKLKCKS